MNEMERKAESAGLKLPVMDRLDAVKSGFRAETHGISLEKEAAIARSVESGMVTVNAVWVGIDGMAQLWRKAAEVDVYAEGRLL